MATEILMPQLGLTMNEGTITEWAKREGDAVVKGDLLFYVENDKAVIPFEAQLEGVLERILVKPMQTVPVGTPVALLAERGEHVANEPKLHIQAPQAPSEHAASLAHEQKPMGQAPESSPELTMHEQNMPKSPSSPAVHQEQKPDQGFVLSSPYARGLAKKQQIQLSDIQGTGPEGAIVARDMPSAAAQTKAPVANLAGLAYEDHKLSRIRQVAAERLSQSWKEIPQFTLSIEANAQGLLNAQAAFKARDEKVSITVLLAKLLAASLADFPLLNASWLGNGTIRMHSAINISIAIDSPDGLVVPTLRNCSRRGAVELAKELRSLNEKAKNHVLALEDLQDGTITISNLGMFGITRFRAIINPPQCAIISVGSIVNRPVQCEKNIEFLPIIEIGLTADHRIVDGAYGARFLAHFRQLIEQPVLALG
ncbi:MAG: dihydrolipoamide acetyltransferase family protein [Rectinema subterraneum]|uniref:dihydrolipoamide acetyltransferase family protein n=1 Tax=Rectinema subterraneum TaxID=2653714 RepID=UPI003C7CA686